MVVRWWKCAHCSTVAYSGNQRELVPKGLRWHGHHGECLHPVLEYSDTSLGKTQSKVVPLERESIPTNPDNSASYDGAWVTCIFELTNNSDFSILPKNVLQTPSV